MTTMANDTTRSVTGLGWALTSAASFALSGPLGSGLMATGWSPAAAVATRVLVAGVVLTPFALRALRGRWHVLRRSVWFVSAYGLVAVAGCQLAYFSAVARLQVGVALLIEYTAPILVVVWLWARHRQRPGVATITGATIGVVGLLLVLDVGSDAHLDPVGVGWALVSMVAGATYFVLSADADTSLPATVLAAAGLLIGGLLLLVAGAARIVPLTVSTTPVPFGGLVVAWWVPVLVLGVVAAAIAYVTGIAAARRLGSRLASFVALLEVPAALVFAWLLLGEAPGLVQMLGAACVLVGIVIVKVGEPRASAAADPAAGKPRAAVSFPR